MGVDPAHLLRAHQVHGTGVVVRRRGDPAAGASLPDADIFVANDARPNRLWINRPGERPVDPAFHRGYITGSNAGVPVR